MAEILVLKGADVNARDDDWWTPLHVACYQDNADIVQLLLTVNKAFFFLTRTLSYLVLACSLAMSISWWERGRRIMILSVEIPE